MLFEPESHALILADDRYLTYLNFIFTQKKKKKTTEKRQIDLFPATSNENYMLDSENFLDFTFCTIRKLSISFTFTIFFLQQLIC